MDIGPSPNDSLTLQFLHPASHILAEVLHGLITFGINLNLTGIPANTQIPIA
jgi:hypothetical protein